MKALKILGGIVVAIVVLIAIAVGLALTPAVQTWAVRRAVANQPGLKLDVARVAAGFSATELSQLHVVKDGMVVTIEHASARYSAWDFLSHHRINVDDLTVDGLVVDLQHPTESAPASATASNAAAVATTINASASPAFFAGILSQIKLPYDVRIARFSIPGRALLPANQTVAFEVHGSDITTGRRGTIDWKIDTANPQPNAPVRAVHSTGSAAIHITTERRIDLAEISAIASAEGAGLPPDQFKLDGKAEQPAAGGNEGYDLHLAIVRGSAIQPLLTVAAQYDAGSHNISGAWNVTVQKDQVAALLNGLGLPDVAANGAGKFTLNPNTKAVTANGELQSDISELQKISAELAQVGTLRLQINFAGGLADNTTKLQHLMLNATTADGRRLAEISTLQPISFALETKRVSFADSKSDLAHISVQNLPLAWAQPFIKGLAIDSGTVSLALAVTAEADGSHVRVAALEPFTVRNTTIRNGQDKLLDQLNLTVRPQLDYADDRIQAALPDLSATTATGDTVAGKFAVDITHASKANRAIAFTSDTTAKVVAALKPFLPANAGPLTVVANSQGTMTGTTLHFDRSTAAVSRPSGEQILRFELLQPLTIDTQSNTFAAAKPDAPTARVQLGHVPLAWANTIMKGDDFAGELTSGTLELTLHSVTDVAATTTQPIALRGVSVTMNNAAMLQNVDVATDFSAGKKGDAVKYNLRRLEVTQGPTSLVKVVVAGELTTPKDKKPAISAKGTVDADMAALMQQPAVAAYASLSRGTVALTFDANVADAIQAKVTLNARNLVAKQDNRPLGDAALNLSATVQADGSSVVNLPFSLTNGARKSDVLLDGKLTRNSNGVAFDGRIVSNQLFVDDLQPLAALAPASQPPAKTSPATSAPAENRNATIRPNVPVVASAGGPSTPPPTPGRDTKPFWTGAGGKIDVQLKQITYGRDYVISDVRGSAAITPSRLALDSLSGKFKENPFKVSATVDFDGKQTQPYTLNAAATVSNVDVGAILQSANPNEPPQLETLVSVNAKLQGNGGTMTDLLQHAYGNFDATGSKGVLRALGKKEGGTVNKISGAIGFLGSLANGGTGSDGAAATADLTKKLAELRFDRFAMHVERGTDLNLKLTSIEFISPDTKVTGSGQITNQAGVPIQNQPLRLTLTLAGKDGMAVILDRLGLLSNSQDSDGYVAMDPSFTLKGTPSNPDRSELWNIVARAALSQLGNLLRH